MPKFLRTALISLLLLQCSTAMAQTDEDLDSLALADQEITRELKQIEQIIATDRERLARAAMTLPAKQITSALLEDARLDLATLLSRQSGLQTRLRARRTTLAQLRAVEDSVQLSLQEDGVSEDQRNVWESALVSTAAQIDQLLSLEAKLEELSRAVAVRVSLARQRQNVLQARFELPDLNELRKVRGPEADEIRDQIDKHLTSASRFRNRALAAGNEGDLSGAETRLLELRAMAEEDKAEFLQMTLTRMQAERLLSAMLMIAGNRSAPMRVLLQGMDNLNRLQEELQEQGRILSTKRVQLADQAAIVQQQLSLSGKATTRSEILSILEVLLKGADRQIEHLGKLQEKVAGARDQFETDIAQSSRASLSQRSSLPADKVGWQQLLGSLATLPVRLADAFVHALGNFVSSLRMAEPGPLLLILLVGSGLVGLVSWMRKIFGADVVNGPLGLLNRHLLVTLPGLIVLFAGLQVGLRDRDLVLIVTPLLIYPLVRIALDFANNFLDAYTPELDKARTRTLVLETRWVVILAALMAGILACAQTVALSPVVIDLIDRLAMVCLLLVSIPLLHLRALLMDGVSGEVRSFWIKQTTLLLPLVLVFCAIAGLLGYVYLAKAVAMRVGLLAIFAVALHYIHWALMLAGEGIVRLVASRDEDSAAFWKSYLVDPLRRIAMLLIAIAAGNLLITLYGWTAETPLVRIVPALLNAPLFNVGETPILLKTLLLGALMILAGIWGGGWSRQVTYRWVFTHVVDQGLRNSLATFTQYLVVIGAVVVSLKVIGLDLTALTVFAGALGVGIGFGMQQIVVNFISGILLLIERPLSTNDQVAVDKYEGEVTRIGIRSLTVKTWDSQEVIIPNSAVITKPFTNWTRTDDIARTVLMVGISYDDEPSRAIDVIKNIINVHPAILDSPAPKVLLWDYADSALMIRVQFHSRIRGDVGRSDLRSQVLLHIWEAFKQAGITIPYPQRDVHLHQRLQSADQGSG